MANTVRDLITGSLRLLGAIQSGEAASAEEAADALFALNEMLDSWNTEGLTIYSIAETSYTLTAGKRDYSLGPTALAPDWPGTRPVKITGAGFVSGGVEYPVAVMSSQDWEEESQKTLSDSQPAGVFNTGGYPNTTIRVWPVPSATGTLKLYTWAPFTAFASINDALAFPPGYLKALRYGLAMALAPEYGKQVSADIGAAAEDAKARIKRINLEVPQIQGDPFFSNGSDLGSRADFLRG